MSWEEYKKKREQESSWAKYKQQRDYERQQKEKAQIEQNKLLEKLNFDMDVSQPSGLSLEQFRKILRYNENVNLKCKV